MIPVYAIATNVISSLGVDTASHWKAACNGRRGVQQHNDDLLNGNSYWASKINAAQWQAIHAQTKGEQSLTAFEQLAVFSARQALQDTAQAVLPDETIVILSTTKGNIELLGMAEDARVLLQCSANVISQALGFHNVKPHVVSHACVSGVLSLTYAMRLLQNGKYKNAIVIGCDRMSRFILSGFESFHAIANDACRPFDANRTGINIGEGAATIVLSTTSEEQPLASLLAGSSSNDANHISGPSRTGEELGLAINAALREACITLQQIGMISAHGTATPYNDEMEAKAFAMCGFSNTPVHSFKGYTGHTLGAAGVLESAMIIESLQHQQLIPSPGFEQIGVSVPLNVTREMQPAQIDYALKTASGFGGCNATAVWGRV